MQDVNYELFADSVEVDGKSYEYAIASRVDESGIIICYYDTTKFQDDKYEISLSNLLDNLVQNKNEVLVVTDGENVISSSAARKKPIIGIAFFAICMTGTSVRELATNRLTPIGGVTKPIARLTTMITPN